MIHDTRIIPTDGRPHPSSAIRAVSRRREGPLGRRRARRRDDELHEPDGDRPERQRQPHQHEAEADRAVQARRQGHRAVSGDGRRSGDVRASVDDVDAADAARRRPHPSVLVPRGEHGADAVARRRTRRGPRAGRGSQEGHRPAETSGAGRSRRRRRSGRRRRIWRRSEVRLRLCPRPAGSQRNRELPVRGRHAGSEAPTVRAQLESRPAW